jgi:ABC-2 type transport system permease protein
MIGAILRAQFLSMRMGNRGRVFGVITGLFWYGIWVVAACAAFLGISGASAGRLGLFLPLGALGVCVYWQAMPILSASMGSALDMRKLMVYPVPHAKLFQVEVLLRLTTGVEMLMVLAGSVAGMIHNQGVAGWLALPAALIYIAFNLLLASGTRSLLERLLSKRKVRELLVFVIFAVWMVPRFWFATGHRPQLTGNWTRVMNSVAWPWTAAARAALGHSEFAALLSLAGWTLLAGWFGRTQFERNLRFDAVAAQATPLSNTPTNGISLQAAAEAFYRFPARWLRDPLAAIVEKELRSLARTPRYRMVFVMGFSFGLMIWLPMILGNRADRNGKLSHHFLTVVCVYALTLLGQVSFWNCFGFDRSAALIYFAAPQPLTKTFAGKNVAALVFIYMEVFILASVTALFGVNPGAAQMLETLLVIGVCSIYMLALGNISSVQYPRALNPERVSQGGASSRFQALIMLLYPLSLLPVLLAYIARYAFASELAFYLVLGFAAVVGAALYWIAMESAVATATKHRERIMHDLSAADGPITSG